MKHTDPLEIEIKIAIPSPATLWPLLEGAGFELVHPQSPEISTLWDRGGALRAAGSALRVRRYGGATLTWKGPQQADPRLKIRPELETAVEDPEVMESILRALGFEPVLTMEKSRSVWRRGHLQACLDEAPFGCYLELEGDKESIELGVGDLGLRDFQVETRSYPALFKGE